MQLCNLLEARRNPEVNSDRERDRLSRYFSPEYFVSFTALPKMGINPRAKYNTPLGIYTYPLGNKHVQKYHEKKNFPYAGNQLWVNVIRARSNNILHLDDPSVDWMALTVKMRKLYINRVRHLIDNDDISSIEQLMSTELTILANLTALVQTPAGRFWNYTRLIAQLIDVSHEGNEPVTRQSVGDDIDLLKTRSAYVRPARWTKLFLDCGIDGVVDNGVGIIHRNEPEQAIFFNTSVFVLVDRWQNTSNSRRSQDVHTKAEFNNIMRYAVKNNIAFTDSFLQLLAKSLRIADTSNEAFFAADDESIRVIGGIGFENTLDAIRRFMRYAMKTDNLNFSLLDFYKFSNTMISASLVIANDNRSDTTEKMKQDLLATGRMNNPKSQAILDMLEQLGLPHTVDPTLLHTVDSALL